MSQDIEENRKKWPGGPQDFKVVDKDAQKHVWQNPSDYDSEYPYNMVHTTPAGHAVEYDDTPNKERIRITHKDKSFWEMQHDGTYVHRSEGSSQEIVVKDKNLKVKGDWNVHIEGEGKIKVDGDLTLEIGGNLKLKIGGKTIFITDLFHVDGSAMSHNDKDNGSTHRHVEVMPGDGISGVPTEGVEE